MVLPAYAGMIPGARSSASACTGAPRVCGDDPYFGSEFEMILQCSPRMRG